MGKISVERYVVGPVQTNCYFVINEETKEVVCVDPGDSGEALAQIAKEKGWLLKAILLTHGHFDHVGGAKAMAESLKDCPLRYILEAERETLRDPEMNAGWMIGREEAYEADVFLMDRQILSLAGMKIEVIATPGHTVGGCSYYFPEEEMSREGVPQEKLSQRGKPLQGMVFSGDSLFHMSVGRTDFKGGSMMTLLTSIKERLLTLPESTEVYPGHGEMTTIGFEKKNNAFIQ